MYKPDLAKKTFIIQSNPPISTMSQYSQIIQVSKTIYKSIKSRKNWIFQKSRLAKIHTSQIPEGIADRPAGQAVLETGRSEFYLYFTRALKIRIRFFSMNKKINTNVNIFKLTVILTKTREIIFSK